MSVLLGSVLEESGLTLEDTLAHREWSGNYGVVSLIAGSVREHNQGIQRDPKLDNPAHALVFTKSGMFRSAKERRALVNASQIVIAPTRLS